MSNKSKNNTKTNKKEWEKDADEILNDVDQDVLKELVKDFLWKEIEKSEKDGKQKSDSDKAKMVEDLLKNIH